MLKAENWSHIKNLSVETANLLFIILLAHDSRGFIRKILPTNRFNGLLQHPVSQEGQNCVVGGF
jgi:hypothetical protein